MSYVNHSLLQALSCKQYIEEYKWNTIKELQLKDPYFKAMVDKYNYDRIREGVAILFKQNMVKQRTNGLHHILINCYPKIFSKILQENI